MKIAHVSIYPPRNQKNAYLTGGVASYEKNLVSNMSDDENQAFVLCNKLDGKYEVYDDDSCRIIRCFDKNPKFVLQILREIKAIKPDVIHIQQELGLFGGIITAYLVQWLLFGLRKYKTVVTLHGVVSLKNINKKFIEENNSNLPVWLTKLGFYLIYKPICTWAKRIIVHGRYFKEVLMYEYRVDPDKIKVIPIGVEDSRAIPTFEARQKLGINEQKDLCLFMGYATGYKGLDLLIEGFAIYAQRNSNAYLILGAGLHPRFYKDKKYLKEYERLQNKAKKLISTEQYRWTGFIPEEEINVYYSASDVSVYPYTIAMSSSGPMALAIGYEKPFLASDVFKNEAINDDLVFERKPNELAAKLDDFFSRKHYFDDFIKIIKHQRLWPKVAQENLNFYQNENLTRRTRIPTV